MSKDEEIEALRQENRELKERVAHLEGQLQVLHEQVSKDSQTAVSRRPLMGSNGGRRAYARKAGRTREDKKGMRAITYSEWRKPMRCSSIPSHRVGTVAMT